MSQSNSDEVRYMSDEKRLGEEGPWLCAFCKTLSSDPCEVSVDLEHCALAPSTTATPWFENR